MLVERIGFTALKGGRHLAHPSARLDDGGPAGDRVLCLLDPVRDRVLRTVENPATVQVAAHLVGDRLRLELPSGPVEERLRPTGEKRSVDYWGRRAEVELVEGPWAAALAAHLGRDVALARPVRARDVVYGGPVSLVTSSSLRLLAERLGVPVAGERFRATFLLATPGLDPHAEDGWVGHELQLGEATVRVRGPVPRCAVVDLDPVSGARDVPVLRTLAGYRRGDGEIRFGVDADVTVPGRVSVGDRVVLGRE